MKLAAGGAAGIVDPVSGVAVAVGDGASRGEVEHSRSHYRCHRDVPTTQAFAKGPKWTEGVCIRKFCDTEHQR